MYLLVVLYRHGPTCCTYQLDAGGVCQGGIASLDDSMKNGPPERAVLFLSDLMFLQRVSMVLLSGLLASAGSLAQPAEPFALREAAALSVADRLAAARAEIEALDRDEVIDSFEWSGPNGASGLLIVTARFPTIYGLGACRRLVHIIRHPRDGGVNPTFDGVVCRSWEGKWSLKKP